MIDRVHSKVLRITAMLVALLACLAMPSHARASESAPVTNVRVRMFQEYKVPASGLKNTFDYRVVPDDPNAPVPVDDNGSNMSTFSLTRDDELWLTFPITARERTTYRYLIEPTLDELPDGLYYVDVLSTSLSRGVNRYYLDMDVLPSEDDASAPRVVPTVHIEGWDGPKVTDPGWRVSMDESSAGADKDPASAEKDPASEDPAGAQEDPVGADKDPAGQATSAAGRSEQATGTASTSGASKQPTAQTGDPVNQPTLLGCMATGAAILLAGARQRGAGGRRE